MNSISVCNMILCLLIGFLLVDVNGDQFEETQRPEKVYKSYIKNRNQLLAKSIMENNNLKQLLSKHNMPDPDKDVKFHGEFKQILIFHLNWYFIRIQKPTLSPYGDAFIEKEKKKRTNPTESTQCMQTVLDAFIEFLEGEQKKYKNVEELIKFINEADNFNFRNDLTRALFSRLDLAECLEKKPIKEQNFYKDLFNAINEEEKWFPNTDPNIQKFRRRFLLVDVNGDQFEETQRPEKVYKSYIKNRNQLLAKSIMENNNLKQLLSKHNMPDPDKDVKFHGEFKQILIFHLNWYFIRIQKPTLSPYGDAFIEKEKKKRTNPTESTQCMQTVLDAFIEFLEGEQKKYKNVEELIKFINEADNFNFRNDLTRALFSRLDLAECLEKKPIKEQNFYKDLFNAINEEEKWFLKIIVNNFVELNNNLIAIVVDMKVEVNSFFIGMNRKQ
ncbi:hypothetical protein LSTR_LSTR004390 [Laodelphax striatellus]|uniref:Uncharacterized protein n=2 Tax=Laodelphax striatellus TaxID=195883 RepID=A0A482XAA8_LAOST|nr:hypothetical protein LSTR_LSTR004390 [Laodelphax striatellus]